ncbi:diacylglycerol/lipid kinase family protein [Streptomyces sp. NPDC005576]|uniref:diacylglycerol/lipid kinase family protein n=1 Tax=unclassified Streptomyces TaxID=2593676 RepID=UPI0033C3704D
MTAPRAALPRRALIVANPTAGTTGEPLIEEVTEVCGKWLPEVRLHRTTRRGDATREVTEACAGTAPPDLVVAVGGDGTVHEVVEALAGGPAALFIVPAGTGNSGYRMLWGDLPWRTALLAVLGATDGPSPEAQVRRVDLAELAESGEKVFLGACSGVIAEALVTARGIALTGRRRYAEAFQRTAEAFIPYPGRVTVDGVVLHEGPTVLANVGGGRYRGGDFLVLPWSEPDDGLLDVCVVGGEVAPTRVPELTRTAAHLNLPGVFYGRGRRILVERLDGAPLVYEHDGELQPASTSGMTLDVLPGALLAWSAGASVGGPR